MQGQQRINISENKPSKFIELSDGYEMISNDATIKIVLSKITVMDGSMESGFYSTKLWIKEDDGWIKVSDTSNYPTKEKFIEKMYESEDFTQAMRDYELSKK